MVWKAETPTLLFFDVDGTPFLDAYKIPPEGHLPFNQ
jgi:hypothetical protein